MDNVYNTTVIQDNGYIKAFLFKPSLPCNLSPKIGCFIDTDDWDEQSLFNKKKESGAEFLICFKTVENDLVDITYDLEYADIVDGFIKSRKENVEAIMRMLNSTYEVGLISIDANDFLSLFHFKNENKRIIEYAQSQPIKTVSSKQTTLRELTNKLSDWVSEQECLEALLIEFNLQDNLSLNESIYIYDKFDSMIDGDKQRMLFQTTFSLDPNYVSFRVLYSRFSKNIRLLK